MTAYISRPGLRWLAEPDRVIVLDPLTSQVQVIHGIEAVIWRAIGAGANAATASRLVDRLAQVGAQEAAGVVTAVVQRWVSLGLLTRDDG